MAANEKLCGPIKFFIFIQFINYLDMPAFELNMASLALSSTYIKVLIMAITFLLLMFLIFTFCCLNIRDVANEEFIYDPKTDKKRLRKRCSKRRSRLAITERSSPISTAAAGCPDSPNE